MNTILALSFIWSVYLVACKDKNDNLSLLVAIIIFKKVTHGHTAGHS